MNAPQHRGADDEWTSYWNGYDAGFRRGIEVGATYVDPRLIDERARELLHQERRALRSWAYRSALERHGPAWAGLVVGEAS